MTAFHRTSPSLLPLLLLAGFPVALATPAGAVYTTFDDTQGGCLDSSNGVNCNHYESKADVYMSGGPTRGGFNLSDGEYFFAIVTPGEQNGGFLDGARGNLSDATMGGTDGDMGIGDDVSQRTFTVSGNEIVNYEGSHFLGTSPGEAGRTIIQLGRVLDEASTDPLDATFDDTDNPGGVYILVVCETGATTPAGCKYDAFKVEEEPELPTPGLVEGGKYYDANTNGQLDAGEVGIANWPIAWTDGAFGTLYTGEDGTFSLAFTEDTYTFSEDQAGWPWMQTGNLTDQTSTLGGSSASLDQDMIYTVTVVDDSTTSGIYFGNICVGPGGGHTLGFWSNKNGAAVLSVDAGWMSALSALNLRKADGSSYDPSTYSTFRSWLLNATATNMAYMLSAQLAAMELNVREGFVSGGALIYAPGAEGANANGFMTVNALMAEANASLGTDGYTVASGATRTYQQALKDALDDGNNNRNFVQAGPELCPIPVF